MTDNSVNNKRIAKNTLALYVRMLFLMLVSLYTSRIILNALGVVDYGIYNVVGGMVTMFSVLSGSLSVAISRFITFELGTGNTEKLKKIFSSSVTIQSGIAIIIIILAETIGIWFLNTKMVIPMNRLFAANWCFQFSVLTFCINLISVPYTASIIAHERMSAFAYISIFEALGKLIVAWCVVVNPIDRLIFFAAMIVVIAVTIRIIYTVYCKRHFEECSYHFVYDLALLKQIFSFAGWNFIGATSGILRFQGVNIVLNLFFGPTINAAQAISEKVNHSIKGFVQNFMMALNPQIMKSYANGDREYVFKLAFQGARFSYYILLLLSLPVILCAHYILVVWLGIVPEHTVLFVQLTLLLALSDSISNPLITIMLATGRIRNYQIVVGGIELTNLPIAFLLLRAGAFPESVVIASIIISQICLCARLFMLRNMVGLSIQRFFRNVYLNVLIVTVIAAIIPFYIVHISQESFIQFMVLSILSLVCTILTEYYVGCNKQERFFVKLKVLHTIKKISNE